MKQKENLSIENKIKIINHIYEEIEISSLDNYSLMNGVLGECLFLANYYKIYRNKKTKKLIDKKVENCIKMVSDTYGQDFSLCNGLTGFVWVMKLLESQELSKFKRQELEIITKNLHSQYCDIKPFDHDFLYGTIGYAHYLVHNTSAIKQIDMLFQIIETNSVTRNHEHEKYWINNEIIDFGMAHGQLSILSFYNKYSKLTNRDEVKKETYKIFNFLYRHISQRPDSYSFCLDSIRKDQLEFNYSTRMGWCYGDLCYFLILLETSIVLELKKEKQEIIQFLKIVLERRNLINYNVIDPTFCHGYSGIISIKNYMRHNFKNVFKNINLDWEVEFNNLVYKNSEQELFFEHPLDGKVKCDTSLLQGLSGIGLMLLSENGKSSCNFLNFFGC